MIYFATATVFFGNPQKMCFMARCGIISKWYSYDVSFLNPCVPEKCYKCYGSTFVLEVKMHVSPDVVRKSCETVLLKIAKKEGNLWKFNYWRSSVDIHLINLKSNFEKVLVACLAVTCVKLLLFQAFTYWFFSDINYIPFFQSSNPSTASSNHIWTPDGNYVWSCQNWCCIYT